MTSVVVLHIPQLQHLYSLDPDTLYYPVDYVLLQTKVFFTQLVILAGQFMLQHKAIWQRKRAPCSILSPPNTLPLLSLATLCGLHRPQFVALAFQFVRTLWTPSLLPSAFVLVWHKYSRQKGHQKSLCRRTVTTAKKCGARISTVDLNASMIGAFCVSNIDFLLSKFKADDQLLALQAVNNWESIYSPNGLSSLVQE